MDNGIYSIGFHSCKLEDNVLNCILSASAQYWQYQYNFEASTRNFFKNLYTGMDQGLFPAFLSNLIHARNKTLNIFSVSGPS